MRKENCGWLVFVLFLLLAPGLAWWDTDWQNFQEIQVNITQNVTDYQLRLNITHDSAMLNNGSDIRIIADDDTTELSIWRNSQESVDGAYHVVWARFNSLDYFNGTQAYLYYGNSEASSSSDFNATFSNELALNGGFENDSLGTCPSGWETCTDTGGTGHVYGVNETQAYEGSQSMGLYDGSGSGRLMFFTQHEAVNDTYAMEFMVWADAGGVTGRLGYFAPRDATGTDFDLVTQNLVPAGAGNDIEIWNGSSTQVDLNYTWPSNEWFKVTMTSDYSVDKNKVWINDQYAGEFDFREVGGECDQFNGTGMSGSTGDSGHQIYLDAYRVRKYIEPLPEVSYGAEEGVTVIIFSPAGNYSTTSTDLNYTATSVGDPIDTCWYSLDGGSNTTIAGCSNTTLSGLSEGSHSVTVWANATNGVEVSDTSSFNVDLTAPVVNVFEPSGIKDSRTINLNYTVVENVTSVSSCGYRIDDGDWTTLGSCSNTTLTTTQGNHTMYFNATDSAGNTGLDSSNFTVDTWQTVWANDTSTSSLVQNFTLEIWNTTDSFTFNSSGYNASWRWSNGPTGNVSLLVLKDGYNHTTASVTINESTDLNYTAQLYPAVVTLWRSTLENYDYDGLRLPITSEISNKTMVLENEPSFIVNDYIFSSFLRSIKSNPGIVWWVNFTGDGSNAVAWDYKLCEIGGSCTTIKSQSPLGSDKSRYVFLKSDGTWEIRTDDGSLDDTGNYANYPAELELEIVSVENPGSGSSNLTLLEIETMPQFENYLTPGSGTPTGNVTITVERQDEGILGFSDVFTKRTYSIFVSPTALYNVTSYHLISSESQSTKFTVQNVAAEAIEGATVSAYRYIDGEYILTTSGKTDGTGILRLNLDSNGEYTLLVAAEGYEPEEIDLTVSETEYTITLSSQFSFFESPYTGISINLKPTSTFVYRDTSTEWNVTIVDSKNSLQSYALNLYANGSLVGSDSGSSPSGGFLSTSFTPTNESSVIANVTFQRFDGDSGYYTRTYSVWTSNETSYSLSRVLEDTGTLFSTRSLGVILGFLVIMLSVFHPGFAVVGLYILAWAGFFPWHIPAAATFILLALMISGGAI